MPGMDGFEVCRRIKARPDTRDAVVIAITAYPSPEAERKALECGAAAYFVKPLDISSLMAKVTAALA
jgi:putative two-component system response regulator